MSHEYIRLDLEGTLPAMEYYVSSHLLSSSEAHEVTQTRISAEYRLHSRAPLTRDYITAIDSEKNLDELLRARAQRMGIQRHKWINAVRHRIDQLYDRAMHRAKETSTHRELLVSYLSYLAATNRAGKIGTVITKAVNKDPSNTTLWVEAVTRDFDATRNVERARGLLQRAVRLIPDNVALYKKMFEIEVCYIGELVEALAKVGSEQQRTEGVETVKSVAEIPIHILDTALTKCKKCTFPEYLDVIGYATVPYGRDLLLAVLSRLREAFPSDAQLHEIYVFREELLGKHSVRTIAERIGLPTASSPPEATGVDVMATLVQDVLTLRNATSWEVFLRAFLRVESIERRSAVMESLFKAPPPSSVLPRSDTDLSPDLVTDFLHAIGNNRQFAMDKLVSDGFLGSPRGALLRASFSNTSTDTRSILENACSSTRADPEGWLVSRALVLHLLTTEGEETAFRVAKQMLRQISPNQNREAFTFFARLLLSLGIQIIFVLQFAPTPPDVWEFLCCEHLLGASLEERRQYFERWVSAEGMTSTLAWLSYLKFEDSIGDVKRGLALRTRAGRSLRDHGHALSGQYQDYLQSKN